MALKTDIFGYLYDDTNPSFLEHAYLYEHVLTGRMYDKKSIEALAERKGFEFGDNDIQPLETATVSTTGRTAKVSESRASKKQSIEIPTLSTPYNGRI